MELSFHDVRSCALHKRDDVVTLSLRDLKCLKRGVEVSDNVDQSLALTFIP